MGNGIRASADASAEGAVTPSSDQRGEMEVRAPLAAQRIRGRDKWWVVNPETEVFFETPFSSRPDAEAAIGLAIECNSFADVEPERDRPTVVCLCGSTRFPEAFALANADLSMRGVLVISLGLYGHADEPRGAKFLTSDGNESTPEKQALDTLHFRKIDLADEILVVNVGDYIGGSTRREIDYARERGKSVRFMFEHSPETSAPDEATSPDAHRDEQREDHKPSSTKDDPQ